MEEFEGGFIQSSAKHDYTGIKTIRNLTIKQLININQEQSSTIFIIDNMEVTSIELCGFVISIKKIANGTIFELDDTTAVIECIFWSKDAFSESAEELIKENALLKITGAPKVFANKKSVNVSWLSNVKFDFFVYHLTNCLYQHLHYTHKLAKIAEKKTETKALPRVQMDILEVYRNNQDENGLESNVVVTMLQGKYNEAEIKRCIDSLVDNCHLYCVGDECYKTTM